MPATSVYIGIDVACGKQKRLPICFAQLTSGLSPLDIPADLAALIPKGPGNVEITADHPFAEQATKVATVLRRIAEDQNWRVERIAIDAPAIAPVRSPRACENAMGRTGLSSFRTPTVDRWPEIIARCRSHLTDGGSIARLPFANMVWMLYGFELYKSLRATFGAEVIETYPAAIVHSIAPGSDHKSKKAGFKQQLEAVAAHTGWNSSELKARLKKAAHGADHDRLDAYMGAWVASLPEDKRRAYGDEANPDDSIWVPLV